MVFVEHRSQTFPDASGQEYRGIAGSNFKTDLNFADATGNQYPGVSVFVRTSNGSLRHFYSGCAIMKDGEYRGLDLLTPLWNFLDLTPEGRGE